LATKKLTTVVIDALEDIKARDVKLVNVSKLTSVFDYIAIASADSSRQTRALAKNVIDKVKESGGWIYGMEGEQSGEWVLVDCGDVVVHIMQPVVREHYKLEELWSEGKLEYPRPVAPRRKPATPKAPEKVGAGSKARSAKPALTRSRRTPPTPVKPKSAKTRTTAAARITKEGKAVTRAKVVAKKPAPKVATTARKKVATTTTVKKTVAKKPVTRRRKAAE
jgi:ribosome-associated protein